VQIFRDWFVRGQRPVVGILTVVLVAFSFVFGGASREHAIPLSLVQLAAIPLFCVAAHQVWTSGIWGRHKSALALIGAIGLVPLLQLVPLPPELWTRLPGREDLVLALQLAETPTGWSSLSVTPDATRAAVWALLAPTAMFLAMLMSPIRQRTHIAAAYVLAAVIAVAIGAAQMGSGTDRLYPYVTTATGNLVGLFANRNHMAALVLMTLPLAAALSVSGDARDADRKWLFALYAMAAVIALGLIRSRAGVILAGPVLIASFLMAWRGRKDARLGLPLVGMASAAAAAIVAVSTWGLAPILARFDREGPEARFEYWPTVLEAAGRYQPVGSGIGSFDPVYRSVEPLETLRPTFFNHAHNEYLELWLEAGWPAAVLLALAALWIVKATTTAFRHRAVRRDLPLVIAAVIGIVVMAGHSFVDYPLRTQTLAVLFAFCVGLLTPPPPDRRRLHSSSVGRSEAPEARKASIS
jgi:O-antigen ligase